MGKAKIEPDWFAVNRSLIKSDLWQSEPFTKSQAWIDLIGLARFADGFGYKRGIEIPLKRGQHCWSEVKLAERWSWSRGKAKRFLNDLETKQQIVQQNTNVTTVTTIVNYDRYQPDGTANSTASSTADGQQTVQQADMKEEGNTNKKVNNISLLPAEAVRIVDLLITHVRSVTTNPKSLREPKYDKTRFTWADSIDKMNRIDERKWESIEKALNFVIKDDFWARNILSGSKLRAQYETIEAKMNSLKQTAPESHRVSTLESLI